VKKAIEPFSGGSGGRLSSLFITTVVCKGEAFAQSFLPLYCSSLGECFAPTSNLNNRSPIGGIMTRSINPEISKKNFKDHQPDDELTRIRGIGAVKKQWLYIIGITSIEQLANCDAIELEKRLKAIDHPVAISELESWIIQAQDFIKAQQLQNLSGKPAISNSSPWQSLATLQLELQQRSVEGQLEWRSIVHHSATQTAALWTGKTLEQFQQWLQQTMPLDAVNIADHSAASVPAKPLPAAKETPHEKPLEITVTQVKFWDSPQTSIAIDRHRLATKAIAAHAPFNLEVNLAVNFDEAQYKPADCHSETVSSANQATATYPEQQWIYQIQCRAKHLGTGQTFCLGDLQANVPLCRNALYSAVLDNLSFPLPGIYRVQVCLTSETPPALPAMFKIPCLQVDAA
jgi:hypothetical protein